MEWKWFSTQANQNDGGTDCASVLQATHNPTAPNYLLMFNSDVPSVSNFAQNEFISFLQKRLEDE